MPNLIECPACGRRLQVPNEIEAASVQCAGCGTAFPAAAEMKPVVDGPKESEPALMSCPYCREDIPVDAKQCRFCGEAVDNERGDDQPWQRPGEVRRDSEPHRGRLILTLGIIGLVLSGLYGLGVVGVPMGIAVVLLSRHDLRRMQTQEMDPQGKDLTQAGKVCGIIGIILGSLWLIVFLAWFSVVMA